MTEWIAIGIIAVIAVVVISFALWLCKQLDAVEAEAAELRKELAEFHASGLKRGKNGQFKKP